MSWSRFDPAAYGIACQELLRDERLCELGPGSPNEAAREKLATLTPESLAGERKIRDRRMASCCLAGLWLLHDFLDESHSLSQEIHTTTGSYWHGILHRHEPDYGNAKYWFQRVGEHPVFAPLHQAARELAEQSAESTTTSQTDRADEFLRSQTAWDPMRFVDLCEAVARGRSTSELLCRRVALAEWQLLFDHCFGKAFGD